MDGWIIDELLCFVRVSTDKGMYQTDALTVYEL